MSEPDKKPVFFAVSGWLAGWNGGTPARPAKTDPAGTSGTAEGGSATSVATEPPKPKKPSDEGRIRERTLAGDWAFQIQERDRKQKEREAQEREEKRRKAEAELQEQQTMRLVLEAEARARKANPPTMRMTLSIGGQPLLRDGAVIKPEPTLAATIASHIKEMPPQASTQPVQQPARSPQDDNKATLDAEKQIQRMREEREAMLLRSRGRSMGRGR